MAVSFKNPPIHEVALGYSFLARPDLLVPYLGQFWAEIQGEYPKCQHAAPIVDNSNFDPIGEFPLPRLWFTSEDGSRLVQLQQDRLIFNWRDIGRDEPYVRFPAIRAEFERIQRIFETYVQRVTGQAIHPAGFILTYVNIIKRTEGWPSFGEVGEVIPDLRWRDEKRFLPPPSELSWVAKFNLPNDFGALTADVRPAKVATSNEPVLRFELAANSGSLGGRAIGFSDWVEVAHHWIVHAFKDLTADKMHSKVWLVEEAGEP